MPPKKVPVQVNSEEAKYIDDLSLHEQILLRPDTYIGSVVNSLTKENVWVTNHDSNSNSLSNFINKQIKLPDGLIRTWIEPASNAFDNIWRTLETKEEYKMTCIKFTIDKSTGKCVVFNDGKPIPIKQQIYQQEKKKMWVPTIAFSKLLSSTNYNDNEKRKTSGRNGYGVKLTNIFSKKFKVECSDGEKTFTSEWSNNMKDSTTPEIKDSKSSKSEKTFTKVTWYPDFARFNITEFSNDQISYIERLIYHYACCANEYKVKVYYNDTRIEISSLRDYALNFFQGDDEELEEESEEVLELSSKDCNVVVMPSCDNKYISLSSVNGIETAKGGVHVTVWEEVLFRPIVNFINGDDKIKKLQGKDKEKAKAKKKKKDNRPKITIETVKNKLSLFVYATLDNPQFESQNKTELITPQVNVKVKESDIKKLKKWKFVDEIIQELDGKSFDKLNDLNKVKTKIENLEHCDYIKSNKNKKTIDEECILIGTEGLSAKTFILSGINNGDILGKQGRQYIGIFCFKGKPINARNASVAQLERNEETSSLIRALRLNCDMDYTDDNNFATLYYKKFVIAADADNDGYHIVSLVYNFFHSRYPSLISRGDFFHFMRTPVLSILKPWREFYFLDEAREYLEKNNVNKNNIKYFKGLGTWEDEMISGVIGKKIVSLVKDDNCDKIMKNIFSKEESGFRKTWLTEVKSDDYVKTNTRDYQIEYLDTSDFVNRELINFSKDHCRRAIANIYDGLNESQRKILFTAFKTKLDYNKKVLKVAQFAGRVAEKSQYHHGESILLGTITNMCQRFVGSNNIPYFYNEGQMGSRSEAGKDAANGRYTFTKLDMCTRYIYRAEDEPYLQDIEEDGCLIEKEYYLPIIPMVLVNGSEGIGTGFSTKIPCYNPIDLIAWIKYWLNNNSNNDVIDYDKFPALIPWYRNFGGTIEKLDGSRYSTNGVYRTEADKVYITEIPVGKNNVSIKKYISFLDDLLDKGQIKTFKNNSDNNSVDFVITKSKLEINHKNLKLTDSLNISNMVLFKSQTDIKKYSSVEQIMVEYCVVRYNKYKERRLGVIKFRKLDLEYLDNKIRFIKEIKSKIIDLDKTKSILELEKLLDKRGYKRKCEVKQLLDDDERIEEQSEGEQNNNSDDDDEGDKGKQTGNYKYLLAINIKSMLKEKTGEDKLQQQHDALSNEIIKLENTTAKQMWINELGEFVDIYNKWNDNESKRAIRVKPRKTNNKQKK